MAGRTEEEICKEKKKKKGHRLGHLKNRGWIAQCVMASSDGKDLEE